jgi:hypothetical protein
MKSSTKNVAKSVRDISYYRQRYRNRVFSKLVEFISEEAQRNQVTQKDMAERLDKDPAVICRLLSQPSNLTLDSLSDILLAVDAEAEPPEIVRFQDRRPSNYMHPLIAKALNVQVHAPLKAETSSAHNATLSLSGNDFSFKFAQAPS